MENICQSCLFFFPKLVSESCPPLGHLWWEESQMLFLSKLENDFIERKVKLSARL